MSSKKLRPSPTESAKLFPNHIKIGNDENYWLSKKNAKKAYTWIKINNTNIVNNLLNEKLLQKYKEFVKFFKRLKLSNIPTHYCDNWLFGEVQMILEDRESVELSIEDIDTQDGGFVKYKADDIAKDIFEKSPTVNNVLLVSDFDICEALVNKTSIAIIGVSRNKETQFKKPDLKKIEQMFKDAKFNVGLYNNIL